MRLVLSLSLMLALTGCAGLDPNTPSGSGRGQQQEYGKAAGGKTVPLSAQQAQRLKQIMAPLISHMDHPIPMNDVRVTVLAESHINAANGGGGDFYVSDGLLKKGSDEHIRAIMAHEIGHADLGHVNKIQTMAAGAAIGAAIIGQIFPGTGQLAPLAGQLLLTSYSRSEETAADRHGVTLLKRAGYNGKQLMINALTWLQQTEGNSGGGFFSTHPATDNRIQDIRNLPD